MSPNESAFVRWIKTLSDKSLKSLFAAILIGAALSMHFWCCDWRLPRLEYVEGELEYVSFDNQLIGFIHAGSQFRIPTVNGALYDLDNAALLGIFLPLVIAFPGVMAVLSGLAPEKCRKGVKRCLPKLLFGDDRKHSCAVLLALLLVIIFGVSGAIGSAYLSESDGLVFVEPAKDSSIDAKFGFSATRTLARSERPSAIGAPTPVPEPSTLVLLGMGALGLLAYAWRKRRYR